MHFYKILRLLITEPGKHHYRRKAWEKEYVHNDTKFISSFAETITDIKIVLVNKSNNTGYAYSPSYDDIVANDWYEV